MIEGIASVNEAVAAYDLPEARKLRLPGHEGGFVEGFLFLPPGAGERAGRLRSSTSGQPGASGAVADFLEKMKPHLAVAEETGVTIAIENHASSLIESPDSMKWLAELRPSNHLGIAFAPSLASAWAASRSGFTIVVALPLLAGSAR